MNIMRSRLQKAIPELYEAFERSWNIAWDEWLPAINVNLDSFNSYPHIRNHEVYLEKLIAAYEKNNEGKQELFSPVELYVLLMSILLHDIGKTVNEKGHGKISRELILYKWSNLGIPNQEIAQSIAKICEFHDDEPEDAKKKIYTLNSIVIDPYGKIREREIASVLTLTDHIDATYLRTVRDYLRGREGKSTLGAFRSKIQGVDIDLEGGLVKVVLGEGWEKNDDHHIPIVFLTKPKENPKCLSNEWNSLINNISFETDKDKGKKFISFEKLKEEKDWKAAFNNYYQIYNRLFQGQNIVTKIEEAVINGLLWVDRSFHRTQPSDLFKINDLNDFCFTYNIADGTTWQELEKNINESLLKVIQELLEFYRINEFPHPLLLAIILNDTRMNSEALEPIKQTLISMGIPIRAWCIEYLERLYNYKGQETVEPIFSKEYLENALKSMWDLSSGIFGITSLSYETLASEMREPDVKKVKRAVRRLEILSRGQENSLDEVQQEEGAFIVCSDSWQWKIDRNITYANKCKFIHPNKIVQYIQEQISDNDPSGDK